MPQWLLSRMGVTKLESHESTESTSDGSPYKKKRIPAYSLTYNRVCESCNNGWMSALEERVKPSLEKLAAGSDVLLSVPNCGDLATWAYKTFALLNLTASGERKKVIRQEDLTSLYQYGHPQGESTLDFFRTTSVSKGKIRTLLPRQRYGFIANTPQNEVSSQKYCFAALLKLGPTLLCYIYRFPSAVWRSNPEFDLRLQRRIWPSSSPVYCHPESLEPIASPEAMRFEFLNDR